MKTAEEWCNKHNIAPKDYEGYRDAKNLPYRFYAFMELFASQKQDVKSAEEWLKINTSPHAKMDTTTTVSLPLIDIIHMLEDYHQFASQQSDEEFSPVKQRRLMFDKFYEWMDTMDEHEFDQYSTTALCETFFFELQQTFK